MGLAYRVILSLFHGITHNVTIINHKIPVIHLEPCRIFLHNNLSYSKKNCINNFPGMCSRFWKNKFICSKIFLRHTDLIWKYRTRFLSLHMIRFGIWRRNLLFFANKCCDDSKLRFVDFSSFFISLWFISHSLY